MGRKDSPSSSVKFATARRHSGYPDFWFFLHSDFAPFRVISRLRKADGTGLEVALNESRITGSHVPMDGSL
jgi:hypothetical protein